MPLDDTTGLLDRKDKVKPEVRLPDNAFWRHALLDAATHLERYGWQQGSFGKQHSRRCALGAILGTDGGLKAERALAKFIGNDNVVTWNDTPGRQAAEVIAVMRAAAYLSATSGGGGE